MRNSLNFGEAEFAGFSAQMDADLQQWAYWLKYVYGYQGYDQSIYQDFDPSQDYSDIFGYPSGDGAYSDLGTQGPDLGNSGEVNLPAGGYGEKSWEGDSLCLPIPPAPTCPPP